MKTSQLYDRADENGAGANTIKRLTSRTPQNNHPESQAPLARQREHAAFQNTVPVQRNDTPSFKSCDSYTGAQKMTRFKSSKRRVKRFPQWHGLTFHSRTLANTATHLANTRWPPVTGTLRYKTKPRGRRSALDMRALTRRRFGDVSVRFRGRRSI